jgi:hypothetical protein
MPLDMAKVVWLIRSGFEDGPPDINYFMNSSFIIKLNLYILCRLTPKALNLQSSFVRGCSIPLLNFFPALLLVATFPGFSQKRPVAACHFSTGFCANLRSLSTNRRRGTAHFCLQKSLVNSKGFGVKQLRTNNSI